MTKLVCSISQEAVSIYPTIAYPFEGTANAMDERLESKKFGKEKCLLLENHGPCALGVTIEEASLMYSCYAYISTKSNGSCWWYLSKLHMLSKEMVQQMISRTIRESERKDKKV